MSTRKRSAVHQQGNSSSGHSQISHAPWHSLSDDNTRTRTAGSQMTIGNTSQENPLTGNPIAISLPNHGVTENGVSEVGLDQPSFSATPLTHDDIPTMVHAVMNNLPSRINNCSPSPQSCKNSSIAVQSTSHRQVSVHYLYLVIARF